MVSSARLGRLQANYCGLLRGDILDVVSDANLQVPVSEQLYLTDRATALRFNALSLL